MTTFIWYQILSHLKTWAQCRDRISRENFREKGSTVGPYGKQFFPPQIKFEKAGVISRLKMWQLHGHYIRYLILIGGISPVCLFLGNRSSERLQSWQTKCRGMFWDEWFFGERWKFAKYQIQYSALTIVRTVVSLNQMSVRYVNLTSGASDTQQSKKRPVDAMFTL